MNSKRVATVFGVLFGALVLIELIVLGYFLLGFYNIAAVQEDHSVVVHGFLSAVSEQSIKKQADEVEVPSGYASPEAISQGALAYDSMCLMCHAAPGRERNFVGKGLFPAPPEMSHALEEFSDGELFWTVKNGIQMAGMPGFGATHSDQEIWDIIAFVQQMPEMTSEEYAQVIEEAKSQYGEHEHGEDAHTDDEEAHSSEESGSHTDHNH